MMPKLIHSAGYYFTPLSDRKLNNECISELSLLGTALNLKGTILLSPEGINIAIAGTQASIQTFKTQVADLFSITQLQYRDTETDFLPFQKFIIKRKKQIIPFPNPDLPLKANAAPYISPEILHQWLHEKQDIIVLDVRNRYEIAVGSFENKIDLQLMQFRDFPQKIRHLPSIVGARTIVTFCTGGIRCEKAAGYLLSQGFEKVYQLQGGILNYFARCSSDHYEGGCFVFDARNALYPTIT